MSRQLTSVIIEDDVLSVKLLETMLDQYQSQVLVKGTANDVKSGISIINQHSPDIIFLDIQLKDMLSFEILDQVVHKQYCLVFVTAYNEYVFKAIRYGAFEYLLKPINDEDLKNCIDRITEQYQSTEHEQINILKNALSPEEPQKITLRSIKGLEIANVAEILYLKGNGNYTVLYLKNNEEIVVTKNIGEFEKILSPQMFYRTHTSVMVNINFVKKVSTEDTSEVILENEVRLPISRRTMPDFVKYIYQRTLNFDKNKK